MGLFGGGGRLSLVMGIDFLKSRYFGCKGGGDVVILCPGRNGMGWDSPLS